MQQRMATCHPDRPHLAKGLCEYCYSKERAKRRKDKWVEGPEGKRADCHPEKRNYSRGLCHACYNKQYLTGNPEKKSAYYEEHRRNWQGYTLRHKFGMTVEEYEAKSEAQGHVCAICSKPENGKRRMSVDHNHTTKAIRGLLCQRCNTLIGMALESEEIINKAIAYLRDWEAKEKA